MVTYRAGSKTHKATYKFLMKEQDGKCDICWKQYDTYAKLEVDHCHKSGKTRGLLCKTCNLGLGEFKDDPELLERAILYLYGRPI